MKAPPMASVPPVTDTAHPDRTEREARARWIVLVVDDEPEVHDITRLVLGDMSFAGIPVELHSAYSAAEAKALLERFPDTALMLLDVVMETDEAGLQLVTYVREQLHNPDLQIVLRTGQPGMAPEREVITGYDINGYALKTEMVAQKLRSILVSSLRAFRRLKELTRRSSGGPLAAPGVAASSRQRAFEEEFGEAVDAGTLHLLAQAQVHLGSGSIAAVELMPHWRRGDKWLGTAQLCEAIRDPELRLRFDEWLIRQGCAWAVAWRALDLPPFRVSLPVLTENIWDCRILTTIEQQVTQAAAPRGVLDLEVPETVMLGEYPRVEEAVRMMHALGLSVTLVDFGSGLLSLPQLQRLLPNQVKIHRSFVRHVVRDRERAAVARSIIALAQTLGLTVIADGVVSEQDLQFFKWEGCDIGQGDLLAKPTLVADVGAALLSAQGAPH
ncbi:MAG: EAL domain-containing protein [Burkholderiales bacterium]|nr:EAL domain-containing protein [Burkholderiales bacterium]